MKLRSIVTKPIGLAWYVASRAFVGGAAFGAVYGLCTAVTQPSNKVVDAMRKGAGAPGVIETFKKDIFNLTHEVYLKNGISPGAKVIRLTEIGLEALVVKPADLGAFLGGVTASGLMEGAQELYDAIGKDLIAGRPKQSALTPAPAPNSTLDI